MDIIKTNQTPLILEMDLVQSVKGEEFTRHKLVWKKLPEYLRYCLLHVIHNTYRHWKWNWPQRQKAYLWTCAPNEDSIQPTHPCSLIKVFAVFMMKRCSLCYPVKSLIRIITKTCLYNFGPLQPHFYIVKLGFTGVYTIFFIFLLKT